MIKIQSYGQARSLSWGGTLPPMLPSDFVAVKVNIMLVIKVIMMIIIVNDNDFDECGEWTLIDNIITYTEKVHPI